MEMVNHGGELIRMVQSATPIDTGNSLAANAEVTNESYFASLDATIFGVTRSAPTVLHEPINYASSFISTSEEETEPGINAALGLKGINPNSTAVGTVITLKFGRRCSTSRSVCMPQLSGSGPVSRMTHKAG
jgi:hypothetical protein